jgi:hypothetical protein
MPLASALASGILLFAAIIVFGSLVYRVAGIRPGPLERRRLSVQLVGLGAVIMLWAVLSAMKMPGAEFYGLGLAALAFIGVRTLQRRGHWLATPTAGEQAELPARRAAMAAARTRLLVLGAGFIVVVTIVELGIVILIR